MKKKDRDKEKGKMSDNKQHIDEFFRRGLTEHKSAPPPEVWEGISSQLSAKRRRRLLVYFTRIAAAVLLLLGSGGIMYYFMQGNTGDNYLSPGNIATHSAEESVPEPGRSPLTIDKEGNKIVLPVAEAAPWPDESNIMAGYHSDNNVRKEITRNTILAEQDFSESRIHFKAGSKSPELFELKHKNALRANLSLNINPGLASTPVEPIINEPISIAYAGTDGSDRRNRWSAIVMVAPNYSYRTLSSINSGSFTKEHYNSFESGLMSVSGSINLNYRISDRFSVQSGLDLLRMGQTIHRMKILSDQMYKQNMTSGGLSNIAYTKASFSNSFGSIEPSYNSNSTPARFSSNFQLDNSNPEHYGYRLSGFETEDLIQGLYYLQTPVLLKYQMINGKTGVTVSGGPGINLLIGNRVILRHEGTNLNIGHTRNINRVSVSGIISVGLERQLFNNVRLLLEPRFSHFISPVNSTGGLLSLPYSFSVFGGLSYGF